MPKTAHDSSAQTLRRLLTSPLARYSDEELREFLIEIFAEHEYTRARIPVVGETRCGPRRVQGGGS